MSARVDREVKFYIAGMSEAERRALAAQLYEYREISGGDDTNQIDTYKDALDKSAGGPA